jgi:hypothetical protein
MPRRRTSREVLAVLLPFLLGQVLIPSVMAGVADATPVAGIVSCDGPNGDGFIIYQDLHFDTATPDGPELTGASFVVIRPDGSELHRIELSDYSLAMPLGVGCMILANDPGRGPLLIDAAAGTARPLALPADYGEVFPANWWRRTYREERWVFIFDGNLQHGVLLDTRTGYAADLAALVEVLRGSGKDGLPVLFLSAELGADESAFLLSTDRDTWLVPTMDLLKARPIPDVAAGRASFSEDGSRILSVQRSASDQAAVVLEALDGMERTTLVSGTDIVQAKWVPGTEGREVLIVQTGVISLVSLPDGSQKSLTSLPPDSLALVQAFSPGGRQVLLRDGSGEVTRWFWVDLDAGTGRQLTDLDGYPVLFGGAARGMRWLTFFPTERAVVEPGMALISLDLETGTTKRPLVIGGDKPYPGLSPYTAVLPSADGRYAILNDLGLNYPGFWLIDAAQGSSRYFDDRVASAVAPDGDRLLVSERVSTGMPPRWRLLLTTTDGQDLSTLAETSATGGFWLPWPYGGVTS